MAGLAGLVLLGAGFVLSLPMVPGPGLVVMALALTVLAAEFVWARWILRELRTRVTRTRKHPFVRGRTLLERGLKAIEGLLQKRPTVRLPGVRG